MISEFFIPNLLADLADLVSCIISLFAIVFCLQLLVEVPCIHARLHTVIEVPLYFIRRGMYSN